MSGRIQAEMSRVGRVVFHRVAGEKPDFDVQRERDVLHVLQVMSLVRWGSGRGPRRRSFWVGLIRRFADRFVG